MVVAGGSFAHWLPDPASVPSGKHHNLWKTAQDETVRLCLKALLVTVGRPAIEPEHLPSGSRRWPAGYVGEFVLRIAELFGDGAARNRRLAEWLHKERERLLGEPRDPQRMAADIHLLADGEIEEYDLVAREIEAKLANEPGGRRPGG